MYISLTLRKISFCSCLSVHQKVLGKLNGTLELPGLKLDISISCQCFPSWLWPERNLFACTYSNGKDCMSRNTLMKCSSWHRCILEHSRMISTFLEWIMIGVGDKTAQYLKEHDHIF